MNRLMKIAKVPFQARTFGVLDIKSSIFGGKILNEFQARTFVTKSEIKSNTWEDVREKLRAMLNIHPLADKMKGFVTKSEIKSNTWEDVREKLRAMLNIHPLADKMKGFAKANGDLSVKQFDSVGAQLIVNYYCPEKSLVKNLRRKVRGFPEYQFQFGFEKYYREVREVSEREAERKARREKRHRSRKNRRKRLSEPGWGKFDEYDIFVGNLPWAVDNGRLEQVFSEHGKVVKAVVIYDRERGRSRGFGYVTMATVTERDNAIAALNGQDMESRKIRVAKAWMHPSQGVDFTLALTLNAN